MPEEGEPSAGSREREREMRCKREGKKGTEKMDGWMDERTNERKRGLWESTEEPTTTTTTRKKRRGRKRRRGGEEEEEGGGGKDDDDEEEE